MHDIFRKLATRTSTVFGSAWAFIAALLLVVGWALTGPFFGWSDRHSLFINTTTTIITFMMVFLIQNSQNRDTIALHLKLDEIIKATPHARNHLLDLDRLSDVQLKELEAEYKRMCEEGQESGAGADKRAIEEEIEDRRAA